MKKLITPLLLAASAGLPAQNVIGTIDSVAGGGPTNLPALQAGLTQIAGVATDAAGNTYVCDTAHHQVYKVDPSGHLTKIGGQGGWTFFFSGSIYDGIPATESTLGNPQCINMAPGDAAVVFVDRRYSRVRRIDLTTGIVSTIAGRGSTFRSGFAGDGGPATQALFSDLVEAVYDPAGNLIISDNGNHRIRRVDAATGIIDTIAGTGYRPGTLDGEGGIDPRDDAGEGGPALAAATAPGALATDAAGNIYFSDWTLKTVRRIDVATGVVTTVAGSGITYPFNGDALEALEANLGNVSALAIDSAGRLFLYDSAHYGRIRVVDLQLGMITTVAGGRGGPIVDGVPATLSTVQGTHDIAFDAAGNLLIAMDSRVRVVDAVTNVIDTIIGNGTAFSGDGGLATEWGLSQYPQDVAVDSAGNLYVVSYGTHRVRRVDAATGILTTLAGNGLADYRLNQGNGGPATVAVVPSPRQVAVDPWDNVYIVDGTNHLRRVDAATGIITEVAQLPGQWDIDTGPDGQVYFIDYPSHRVSRIDPNTGVVTVVAGTGVETGSVDGEGGDPTDDLGDGGPATSATLDSPTSVAVDLAGNVYIGSIDARRIRMVDTATGIIATIAGNGEIGALADGVPALQTSVAPNDLAVDADGNVYSLITGFTRVRRVDKRTGLIDRVAGAYGFGFRGDGGDSRAALFATPNSIALDPAGNLYVCDMVFSRIRKVTLDLDCDADGLRNIDEWFLGTGICNPDSDDDGLLDGAEVILADGSGCPNPLVFDSDGDTLGDGFEVLTIGCANPCAIDTDGDGVRDDADSLPCSPGVTNSQLEEMLLELADDIRALPLSVFDGQNTHVQEAMQSGLAGHAQVAARQVRADAKPAAQQAMQWMRDKLDGVTPPADWITTEPERGDLLARIDLLASLVDLM